MRPTADREERPDLLGHDPCAGPSESEVDDGLFTLLCPRFGVLAALRVESVSGSVRSFSCSVPGSDGPARRRCQAACARWVLGEA